MSAEHPALCVTGDRPVQEEAHGAGQSGAVSPSPAASQPAHLPRPAASARRPGGTSFPLCQARAKRETVRQHIFFNAREHNALLKRQSYSAHESICWVFLNQVSLCCQVFYGSGFMGLDGNTNFLSLKQERPEMNESSATQSNNWLAL